MWSSSPSNGRNELWDLTNGYMPLGSGNLPPLDSIFTACIKSTDTLSGCISYKCKNIVLDTSVVGCVANFDVIKETVMVPDLLDYSEVTLSWIDGTGKSYSSDRFNQPNTKRFEIINATDYIDDVDGNPTKKITLKFSVRLFGDSESDFKDFDSEESVIAISYL